MLTIRGNNVPRGFPWAAGKLKALG